MSGAETEVRLGWRDRMSDRCNPIVVKEVRQAMRGDTFFKSLWAVLVISALFSAGMLMFATNASTPEELGMIFFMLVYVCMSIALLALTPVAAFQSLAGEWDDNSFELLTASELRPGQIVRGKLYSALIQGGLIGFAFLPMLAVALTLPGLDPLVGAGLLVVLVLVAFMATSIALGIASFAQRKPVRILALGLVVTLSFVFIGMLANFGGSTMSSPQRLFDPAEIGPVGFLCLCSFFVTGFGTLMATARVAHPEDNKSTNLRRWTVFVALASALVAGVFSILIGATVDFLEVAGFIVVLLTAAPLYFFATESRRLPRRVEFELRSGTGPRLGDLMLPGASRGLLLALVLLPGTVAVMAVLGSISGEARDLNLAYLWALILLGHFALASFLVRLLESRVVPAKLRLAYPLALAGAIMVTIAVGRAVEDFDLSSGAFVLNPAYLLDAYAGDGLDWLVPAGDDSGSLWAFVLGALLLNLPGILAGIRERRALALGRPDATHAD